MIPFPRDLDEAIAQAQVAAQAAMDAGYTRLQVEIVIQELKLQPIAKTFIQPFTNLGAQLRIFFPDPGAAALARRDWGETPYTVRGLQDINSQIQPEETLFIFVEPSSVEVEVVEKLCEEVSPRPVIFLNPILEDFINVGVGYTGRQIRDRFLKSIESCYYLRPLEGAALFRCYPQAWQLWLEQEQAELNYELIAEFANKPDGESIEQVLSGSSPTENPTSPEKPGLWTGLQRLLRF